MEMCLGARTAKYLSICQSQNAMFKKKKKKEKESGRKEE